MVVHYTDDHLTVHIGDCRSVLATLPAESVHCVVTSPPYWGLRDYGVSDQLGLEPTPEAFIANMVNVFREVRRVLRADGTLWLNMGDSYASHDPGGYRPGEFLNPDGRPPVKGQARNRAGQYRPGGLKPKDLVGMPWRLAFALQADGWYLRSDIIWAKPNPMPESVTDRPTKSHEYVFLLTKSARYFYDADAVRESPAEARPQRRFTAVADQPGGLGRVAAGGHNPMSQGGSPTKRDKQRIADAQRPDGGGRMAGFNDRWDASEANGTAPLGRNLRSVWQIATEPYPGAHFATFPQKLVEPCIKAGTSERGVCPECGAPFERVIDIVRDPEHLKSFKGYRPRWDTTYETDKTVADGNPHSRPASAMFADTLSKRRDFVGWRPGCPCYGDATEDAGPEPIPATVLDPFAGSGTTGLVANRLGRRAILIDLSADYIDQAMLRNQQAPLGMIG